MRLIDADALIGGFGDWYVEGEEDGDIEFIGNIKQLMDYIATVYVDAVPVIRCKDCKWSSEGIDFKDMRYCSRVRLINRYGETEYFDFSDDDFCSWAERREE